MRTRAITHTLLVLVVLVAAACGGESDPEASPGTQSPGTAPADVAGREFLSTDVTGRELVDGTRVRLVFTNKLLYFNAGCNQFSATYHVEGNQLVATKGGGTEMGCDEPRHDQDAWLTEFLASRPTLTFNGDSVTLTGATTTLTLLDREVADPDKPLVGPTWIIDTTIESGTSSSVPDGVEATIVFPSDTRIEVYDGCNRTSGAVEVGDNVVKIIDLPEPVRANCEEGSAVDYAKVLYDDVGFEINASRLTLNGPNDAGFGLHAE